MIEKKIQTKFSNAVNFSVLGKEETRELEGIPKETLSIAIRELVAKRMEVAANKVFLLEQVHGDRFYNTKDLSDLNKEGDALYTTEVGEILIVKTADCMPLFFWSEVERIIGVIHSGWKGTELGISEKVFEHLKSRGYSLEAIQSYLGPCARKRNYEVSEDLFQKFKAYAPEAIESTGNGKYLLGIDIVLRRRLLEKNIPIHFSGSDICTIDDTDYHSHRLADKGRNLNLIWLS